MSQQPYFVLVLAHSFHGRLRRIHIPHKAIHVALGVGAVSILACFIVLFSYLRMSSKVAGYNSLRQEVETLRSRYRELQRANSQKTQELATLEMFASEVSVSYGLKRKPGNDVDSASDVHLVPTYRESLDQYNFLKAASYSPTFHNYPKQYLVNTRPSLWPIEGRLMSSWGGRSDPFSGDGVMHTGLDISAKAGTPVRVAADGVVESAEWGGGYGKLAIVDHGNGVRTYYAHLSRFDVIAGQEVRRGDVIALSGGTGRATGPHLHFEVRLGGTPVNPYPYLAKAPTLVSAKSSATLGF